LKAETANQLPEHIYMNKPLHILVTGVGGPTPRSVARSLLRHAPNLSVKLFGTDTNPRAHGLYQSELYASTGLLPRASSPDYWSSVEAFVREHSIGLAMVQPEQEVLAWSVRRDAGLALPCSALLPSAGLVELLIDKSLMTKVLEPACAAPASVTFTPAAFNFEEFSSKLGLPFWVRATKGSSGLGSLKIKNKQELENWIRINPAVDVFIASRYLPGRNLACKLLYWEGELVRAACGERVDYIMSKVAPSGITGNTSFGRLLNEDSLVLRAEAAMRDLFKAAKATPHGFYTMDFKEDESGKPYITEVNVRMVAFNLCFAMAGANFSEDIVRLLLADTSFDKRRKIYQFPPKTVFLRDVDSEPILMNEDELLDAR
jgi:hypothetical protein